MKRNSFRIFFYFISINFSSSSTFYEFVSNVICLLQNEIVGNPLTEVSLLARTDITTIADIVVSDISWKPVRSEVTGIF